MLTLFNAMEVTYELTQRDFFDAFISHRNRSTFAKWAFRGLKLVLFAFLSLALGMFALRHDSKTLLNIAPLIFLAAIYALFLWAIPWWGARTQFTNQPAAQGPRTMLLDKGGVHWRWNGGSAEIEWKNFIRFQETKTHFLLYSSPACFNIVPKRVLAVDQIDSFRKLATENLPQINAGRHKGISPQALIFLVVVGVAFVLLVMVIRNAH